jgi:hypothetical protein
VALVVAKVTGALHGDDPRQKVYARCPDTVTENRDRPCLGSDQWEDSLMAGETYRQRDVRIAHCKTLCYSCPVRNDCLMWALTEPDPAQWHIAGGLTTKERRKLRNPLPPMIRHGWEPGYRQHLRRGEEPCGPCRDAFNAGARDRAARNGQRLRRAC